MSTALFNLDSDGTLEILISRANIKKITRVMIAEPGKKTAKNFLLDTQPLESEWELNPGRCTCEHFRCKKCHFINCVAVKYCGECGAKMKNAGVKPEDLPCRYECTCRWHESYTWVCFNGLSLNCTDVTDVEDSCEHWEKRTDDNGIEDYEVN